MRCDETDSCIHKPAWRRENMVQRNGRKMSTRGDRANTSSNTRAGERCGGPDPMWDHNLMCRVDFPKWAAPPMHAAGGLLPAETQSLSRRRRPDACNSGSRSSPSAAAPTSPSKPRGRRGSISATALSGGNSARRRLKLRGQAMRNNWRQETNFPADPRPPVPWHL